MSQVEKKLELLFEAGTWIATIVVAIGVLFSTVQFTKTGIAIFILIPIGRVIGLFMNFLKSKDYKMAAIAMTVFFIIMISFTVGLILKTGAH